MKEGSSSLVLVTGANGFLGSHLVESLLAKGYAVRCMVRPTSDLTFIRDLPVEWSFADIGDESSLRRACEGVDAVLHCAGLTRALDEETFMQVNAWGTEKLAKACLEASPRLKRLLFISSIAACGPSQGPDHYLDELCRSHPITWYGKSKLAAEEALRANDGKLPLTIIRPAAVFGPRDRDFLTYFSLVRRGLSLQLGRQERLASLIYVRDLVELLLLALESEEAADQTFFGCGQAHSYSDFSDAIAQALGKHPIHVTLPEAVLTPISLWSRTQGWLTCRPALLNDQRVLDLRARYWLCSGAKAKQSLGFVPRYDLKTAVQETADWYLQAGWL